MTTVPQGLSEFLHRYIPEIEREMYSFLPNQEPEDYMYAPMRDYPERGGKRFRELMLECARHCFDASRSTVILGLAAAAPLGKSVPSDRMARKEDLEGAADLLDTLIRAGNRPVRLVKPFLIEITVLVSYIPLAVDLRANYFEQLDSLRRSRE